ncbi:MurR/RpiR family transcriptional regulator [Bacillus sp. ISL-45]|uniref:MurR/RpiR family transcriptional regulator n=1 Tax=Bacillus sp. ISL-45 TaxID=2819128 RepID=UPI001BEBE08B|nr:MurR/RpiR family transcriptional regulator [Bacillus sp. ISL-45]MBT2661622.1 MurR/RpiR family transcriptional regulator [Bacillus sp. ISL-45]
MRFKDRVQKFEYKLNDTDDQIVEYILQNKQQFTVQSIQSLAATLFTVPNTITRLSKKLGYDGFSHLKNSIKDELDSSTKPDEDSSYYFIQKTFELLDIERIETISKMIQDAKHILFYGVGDSADFCEMMVRNLRVVGKQSQFSIHRHEILHMLEQMNKQDVLFLISLSGETQQVLEIAKIANQKDISIVTLTHFTRNSLQTMGSVNLYCYAPKKMKNGFNITDRTPVMIVLQALSQNYWESF